MKQHLTQNNAIKLVALVIAASLILSVTLSTSAFAEVKKDEKKDAEKDSKKDPMQEKLATCKAKKTQREQYECEKALKASSGNAEFKAKATKKLIGPIAFYYAGATVEKVGSQHIVNLKFLVENTDPKKNITLFCTGPAVCNYDVSDGKTTYKYASQDFTNGQIVLKPGASRIFNMLFGPAIGYGSYVDFKFDPKKQYMFNVREPWGSGSIPLNLK